MGFSGRVTVFITVFRILRRAMLSKFNILVEHIASFSESVIDEVNIYEWKQVANSPTR